MNPSTSISSVINVTKSRDQWTISQKIGGFAFPTGSKNKPLVARDRAAPPTLLIGEAIN